MDETAAATVAGVAQVFDKVNPRVLKESRDG